VLDEVFADRLAEIDSYLDLLAALEAQVQNGPPKVGEGGPVISATQQRILYSSVYLQLYNLVEATINMCADAVCVAIAKDNQWMPSDLSEKIRAEWVRQFVKTHENLNYENRLERSLKLCDYIVSRASVGTMKIEKGGGGNWNDIEIFEFAKRLGCDLVISQATNMSVKSHFKDELGALILIVKLRNDLAHGSLSFGECGANVTVEQLRDLKTRTATYMREVVMSFKTFISTHSFLDPISRPQMVAK
jgi:hypothetical protein